jgi:hypothetical protein
MNIYLNRSLAVIAIIAGVSGSLIAPSRETMSKVVAELTAQAMGNAAAAAAASTAEDDDGEGVVDCDGLGNDADAVLLSVQPPKYGSTPDAEAGGYHLAAVPAAAEKSENFCVSSIRGIGSGAKRTVKVCVFLCCFIISYD